MAKSSPGIRHRKRHQRKVERKTRKKEVKWQAKTTKVELKAAKMDYFAVKHAYKAKKRQLRHNRKHSKKGFTRMPVTKACDPEDTRSKQPPPREEGEETDSLAGAPPSYDDVAGDLPSYEAATQPLYPVLM